MRVVFLTHNYPRTAADVAGAFLHPLALELARRGHELRVVAPSDAGQGGADALDGIPVTRVRYAAPGRERYAYTGRMQEALRSPAGWQAMASMVRALRRGVREALADPGQPAVVHAHWWFPAGMAVPPAVPAVLTAHGTDVRLLDKLGARLLARRAFRQGRVVTAVSQYLAGQLEAALGIRVDADHVSPMPVATGIGRSTGGGGLVFVGRLSRQKRAHLALEAHALLGRQRPDLRLTVIGDGPERPALEALAQQLGTTTSLRFLGQVAPEQVATTLGSADLGLFPGRAEGFGLAAVEALVAGIPIVGCRDGGGTTDILGEPGAGLLADPTGPALAAAAERLLDDPGAADRAALAGVVWQSRLTASAVADRCEGWYREALGG